MAYQERKEQKTRATSEEVTTAAPRDQATQPMTSFVDPVQGAAAKKRWIETYAQEAAGYYHLGVSRLAGNTPADKFVSSKEESKSTF